MLFIGLLLLAPTAQAWPGTTKYASVEGSVICDNHIGNTQLLQDVRIQLREYDRGMEDDSVGTTYTTSGGQFSVTGSATEFWGHEFFVEVKVPCWGEAIKGCANKASMCDNSRCEYYVKINIPKEYYYEEGERKKTFRLTDINVEKAEADERKSMCP